MVKFIQKKTSNKVSICVLLSIAVTFKESQKWKYIWVIYMDGYDGHVNVCPYSLPPLIWCCNYPFCEEKMLWKTPSPISLVKNNPQSQQKGQRCWWLGDWCCLKYTVPSLRNISSAVQFQIFHEHLRNSHYVTLRQKQILSLQHFSPSVNF